MPAPWDTVGRGSDPAQEAWFDPPAWILPVLCPTQVASPVLTRGISSYPALAGLGLAPR